MFSLRYLDKLAEAAGKGLSQLNSRILQALGKRIALAQKGGFDRFLLLTEADREADKLYLEILRELNRSGTTAGEIYAQAAKMAYESANKYYLAKGMKQLPIEYQNAIVNFVKGAAMTTRGTFTNLSKTGAIGFRVLGLDGKVTYRGFKEHYHHLIDQAISEVATGQKSYNSAFRQALKQTADSGIRVLDYESGYSRRLDSVMRQNVIDGVKDIAHEIARQTGEEFGADGVEIDAHNLCAPDHLPFQGRQFSNKEFEDIQDSLERQFGMWNCRHTHYPILLGVSSPLYTEAERQAMIANSNEVRTFEGKEYTAYEATQLQRRIETKMRQCKDRAVLAKAAGDDLTRKVEQLRLNQLKDKYNQITTLFKTPAALDRAAVSGFRPVGVKGFEGASKINTLGNIELQKPHEVFELGSIGEMIEPIVAERTNARMVKVRKSVLEHVEKHRDEFNIELAKSMLPDIFTNPAFIYEGKKKNTLQFISDFGEKYYLLVPVKYLPEELWLQTLIIEDKKRFLRRWAKQKLLYKK